jgi:hypothetical protein
MTRTRVLHSLWLLCILALVAVHFVHLRADFPNFSPWMDYAKYTDEGWYANAAIRHSVSGSWYLHGDFNPAVALPVWPLLVAAVFHFTGVSLAAARALALAVFAANLWLTYLLVRTQAKAWTALLALTILAGSAFLYAFSRLAILEPLLMFFLMLSWLAILHLPGTENPRRRFATLASTGILLCLMVLTKTTAVFVIPSTLFLICNRCGYKWRPSLAAGTTVVLAALIPWSLYYFLLARPHYRVDYHYLFDSNKWPQPSTLGGWIAAFWYALHGTLWISSILCCTAAALLLVCALLARRLSHNPLIGASLLAAAGYIFFAGWHVNPQPRYNETVIYPLAIVLSLAVAALLSAQHRTAICRALGGLALTVIVVCTAVDTRKIIGYTRHPEYTFLNAAEGLTRYIDQHPNGNRMLLSISGDQIQLVTHLPSICDDYGPWDLPYRIHIYRPGWYAQWNELDPGTLEDLHTQYTLQQVASFPAFDDDDRNNLVLYKLNPLPPAQQRYEAIEEEKDNAGK